MKRHQLEKNNKTLNSIKQLIQRFTMQQSNTSFKKWTVSPTITLKTVFFELL